MKKIETQTFQGKEVDLKINPHRGDSEGLSDYMDFFVNGEHVVTLHLGELTENMSHALFGMSLSEIKEKVKKSGDLQ